MLVKTFQAADMAEALRMVKAELGPDAMIISSKKERRKGLLGFFTKPVVQVTAALDVKPQRPADNPYREPERERSTKEEFQNSMLAPLARELKDLRDKVEQMSRREAELKAQVEVRPQEPAETPQVYPLGAGKGPAKEAPRAIQKQDLEEMKKLLFKTLAAKEAESAPTASSQQEAVAASEPAAAEPVREKRGLKTALRNVVLDLHRKGLERTAIRALIDQVKPEAKREGLVDSIRDLLPQAFKGVVRCAGPITFKKSGPRIIALVGPTGVGKTTTIAKLAALYALREGHQAALITIDNFRVGAVEQLKTYSRIMGIPLEVASTPAELEAAIEMHSSKELILIDTAGRSPRDLEKVEELKGFLENKFAIEIHLCLAATTRDRELQEVVDRFGILPISRVIFTKLDESDSYGCMVNLYLRNKFPLSYFTTGQRVPEDLEIASAGRLAGLILGDRK